MRTLGTAVAAVALVALPCVDAVKVAAVKPLNFTAWKTGDAWRRKKAELQMSLQNMKLDRQKKAAEKKAAAVEKKQIAKMKKEAEAAAKKAEQRPLNLTHMLENNSIFNGSLVTRLSSKLSQVPKPPAVNITNIVQNNKFLNGSFFEHLFHKHQDPPTPAPCLYPLPGEKIFYIIQGAMTDDSPDSRLVQEGLDQLQRLRQDPRLSRALSHGPQRAQVVITGTMRKTLETAIRAFGDLLPDAKWEIDGDVRGRTHESEPWPDLGVALLKELNASDDLQRQYEYETTKEDHGTHEDRWRRFIDHMRKRKEEHFILVTHNFGCDMTALDIPIGEVRIGALVPDPPEEFGYVAYGGNAWRKLSRPLCWPDPDKPNQTRSGVDTTP